MLTHIVAVGPAASTTLTNAGQSDLLSLAIALGGGLGAVGSGLGIGMIFWQVIDSIRHRPATRAESPRTQFLGFGRTEAVFFYGLVAALLAFAL